MKNYFNIIIDNYLREESGDSGLKPENPLNPKPLIVGQVVSIEISGAAPRIVSNGSSITGPDCKLASKVHIDPQPGAG